jgi:hypothetical protein
MPVPEQLGGPGLSLVPCANTTPSDGTLVYAAADPPDRAKVAVASAPRYRIERIVPLLFRCGPGRLLADKKIVPNVLSQKT